MKNHSNNFESLKVLHISYKDGQEGAAIAARRICEAQVESGINAKLLVLDKTTDLDFVETVVVSQFQKLLSFIQIRIDLAISKAVGKNKEYVTLPVIGKDISKNPLVLEADVIHLHWINRGFLSINSLNRLTRLKKPIFWTTHDYWPVTGGCHYFGDCREYMVSCKSCPKARFPLLISNYYAKKMKVLSKYNITICAPSTWVRDRLHENPILESKNIRVLPNTIPNEIYKQVCKSTSKRILNINEEKKVILVNISSNPIKGKSYFENALLSIPSSVKKDILIIGFGSTTFNGYNLHGFESKALGKLFDDYSMMLMYNSADVYVTTSLDETFGQTILEAMSCGTPCVAFNYSGPKDLIDHGTNGFLAEYRNSKQIADGILFCFESGISLGINAREKVDKLFKYKKVAELSYRFYKQRLEMSND